MTPGLTWQLFLRGTADQVFAAVQQAASADGRAFVGNEHDRRLVFSGLPGGPGERTRLCAFVTEHGDRTLLQFGPPEGRTRRRASTRTEAAAAEVAEAASIGSLVHRMRSFLGSRPMQVR